MENPKEANKAIENSESKEDRNIPISVRWRIIGFLEAGKKENWCRN